MSQRRRFNSFKEFYPFYLEQHANTTCRRLHFVGTLLVFVLLLSLVANPSALMILLLPIAGYGFAWVGHFVFEKNKPATFQYPVYSLMGDFRMFKDTITGKIPF